ncbi:MAG: XRE family transcriptional regulator [Candidatus Hydrogenedentes bacterium]|nr:XRE family transcriptional regulator [Candidatus Hydrogenedentota bacterium]
MTAKIDTDVPVTVSAGNVFADLGLPEPDMLLAKAELARQINAIIKKRGLTQTAAAKLLGENQANISRLAHGYLSGFSVGRLLHFLNLLGRNIEISVVQRRSRKQPYVRVVASRTA